MIKYLYFIIIIIILLIIVKPIIFVIYYIISKIYYKINKKETLNDLILNEDKLFYYPCIGLTNFDIPIYTDFNSDMAKIYFSILNKSKFEYYIFAGSAIGLVRDGKNIPWVDDYDIIIFKKNLKLFKKKIIPLLQKNGIITSAPDFKFLNFINKILVNNSLFTQKFKYKDYHQLDVDIFTSYLDKYNNIKCMRPRVWGTYCNKNLNLSSIKPAKYYDFDNFGFKVPFLIKLKVK